MLQHQTSIISYVFLFYLMNSTANQSTYNHIVFLLLAFSAMSANPLATRHSQLVKQPDAVWQKTTITPLTEFRCHLPLCLMLPCLSAGELTVLPPLHFVCLAPSKTRKPSTNIPICVKWQTISTLIRLF